MSNAVLDRFENRDLEMNFVKEHCLPLLRESRPINPQFIEFNGVWGIGKTTILRKIEHYCSTENLYPIWIDASDNSKQLLHKIAEQVRNRYQIPFQDIGDDLDRALLAMQALLKRSGMAVVFIDSLDTAEEEHLKHIRDIMQLFMENGKLLFILASRNIIDFGNTAPFKWKLKFFPLKAFSFESCITYIKKIAQEFKEEEINQLFLLTGGYPAAVDVAVETARQEKLDLATEQDQKRLMQVINDRVIEHGVFASVLQDPDQLSWYQTMLSIFAVPRRFNLALMQKLIERFAREHKLSSSLAYISLQQRMNFNTGLLDWREDRTGYALESPVRHLFLMKLKIENSDRHGQIHEFLMEENWHLALQTTGTDRLHSLQEYLYHSASCLDDQKLKENVDKALEQVLSETLDMVKQFEEEYKKDADLQGVLGMYKERVLAEICQFFARSYLELVPTLAANSQARVVHLRDYIFYSLKDPGVVDRLQRARQSVERIRAQETAEIVRRLIETLKQDAEIKELLGSDTQAWNLG